MKKIFVVVFLAICISAFPSCRSTSSSSHEEDNTINNDTSSEELFVQPQEQLEQLEQIDSGIANTLTKNGYSIEHASAIQEILNTVGIESIEIESMTGEAENGVNAVVCYPNGYTERDRRFYFTTENGVIFYAGFSNEDLYDSASGGYLKSYDDVHIPEKEVTTDVYETLRALATEEVKSCLTNPDSADFGLLDWGIGRSDNNYQIIGSVTAENNLGVEDEIPFSVWFVADGDNFLTEGVALNGTRVK